jgi:Tfp pilus assembly protein PilO
MSQGRALPIIGLAVIVGVSSLAFVAPGIQKSRRLGKDIREFRAELKKPNSGPEVIGTLSKQLDTLRALSDRRMTPIPQQSNVAGLITDLSAMLDSLNLSHREITTGNSRTLEEASSMPMTVTLQGPFPSIAEAVRQIESLPRLVRVQRLRVSTDQPRRGEVDRSGEVRADVLIEVFYAPQDVLAEAKGAEE